DLTDKKSVIENEDVINNCVELIAEQKRTIQKLQHEAIGMKTEIALQNGAINSFKETIAYKNNVIQIYRSITATKDENLRDYQHRIFHLLRGRAYLLRLTRRMANKIARINNRYRL
uniref:BBS2_C domain-containing protein n=1 Tax=Parastrongyloides trichosuri TaxID=131310 RepID=A0A0N4ZGR9_PARTI